MTRTLAPRREGEPQGAPNDQWPAQAGSVRGDEPLNLAEILGAGMRNVTVVGYECVAFIHTLENRIGHDLGIHRRKVDATRLLAVPV